MRQTVVPLLSLALLLLLPPAGTATAQEEPAATRGFYVGAGVGSTEPTVLEDSDYWYAGDFESGDAGTSALAFAGYRFNRYFAVEAGYLDADGMGFDDSLVYVPDLLDVYNTDVDLDATAAEVSVLGIFPFLRIWEVYARLGLAFWDAESEQRLVPSFGGTPVERSLDDSGTGIAFGIGGGVTVVERLHLRLEYRFFDVDEDLLAADSDDGASIDTFALDVQYRFGGE